MISTTLGSSERFFRLYALAGDLVEFAMAAYPLIVSNADEFGRLLIDPFTVKMRYFPISQRSPEDFARMLDALSLDASTEHPAPADERAIDRLFVRYRCEAGIVGQIVNFDPHQIGLIHKRKHSKFPPPPGWPADIAGRDGFRLAADDTADELDLFRDDPEHPGTDRKDQLKGREEKLREGKGSKRDLSGDPATRRQHAQALVELYHEICCPSPVPAGAPPALPRVRDLTPKRIAHACARLRERPISGWRAIFERARRSPFLCGLVPPRVGSSSPFVADFDWFVSSPDNVVKLEEGRYDERRGPGRSATAPNAGARQQSRQRHTTTTSARPHLV